MPSTWQTSTTGATSPGAAPVAIYKAIVGSSVESSTLQFVSSVDSADAQRALETPPRWVPGQWPERPDASSVAGMRYLALLKMRHLLDAGAGVASETATGIETELDGLFPATASGSARYEVTVVVQIDGQASWGVREISSGPNPRGAEGDFSQPRSNLQVLVQNLVRADLLKQLGS